MADRIFALDTTFFHFAVLVEHVIKARQFHTGWGLVTLRHKRRRGEVARFLDVWVRDTVQPDFTFEVVTLSPERISVTAKCRTERYSGIFDELLSEIDKRWSSSLQQSQREVSPAPADRRQDEEDAPRDRMNTGTAIKVAEAWLRMEEEGKKKKVACQLVGVDPKTFNRWKDAPEVARAIERLKREREELNGGKRRKKAE